MRSNISYVCGCGCVSVSPAMFRQRVEAFGAILQKYVCVCVNMFVCIQCLQGNFLSHISMTILHAIIIDHMAYFSHFVGLFAYDSICHQDTSPGLVVKTS